MVSTLCLYGTAASAQGTPAQPLQLETLVVGGPAPVEELRAPTVRLGGAQRAYENLTPEPSRRARRFAGTGLAPGATLQPDQLVQNSRAGGAAMLGIGVAVSVGGILALLITPFAGTSVSFTSGITSSGSTAGFIVGGVMLLGGVGLIVGGAVSLRRAPGTGNNAATRTLYSRAVAPRVLPLLSLAGPDARPSLGLTLSF